MKYRETLLNLVIHVAIIIPLRRAIHSLTTMYLSGHSGGLGMTIWDVEEDAWRLHPRVGGGGAERLITDIEPSSL